MKKKILTIVLSLSCICGSVCSVYASNLNKVLDLANILLETLDSDEKEDIKFTSEIAKRAAVTAFTNFFATDIFTEDGNSYDESKFHSYADVSGYHWNIQSEGVWEEQDNDTWHVSDLRLYNESYGSEIYASLNVEKEGNIYKVQNLQGTGPSYEDLSILEQEDDYSQFFYVSEEMIQEDRRMEIMDESPVTNEITPEFKQLMDSYEAFFDEYLAFMKKYESSDDVISMMGDYTNYMLKYAETIEKLDDIDESQLSDADALYYLEVTLRINQKLLQIAE